jgi:hypothetical protein
VILLTVSVFVNVNAYLSNHVMYAIMVKCSSHFRKLLLLSVCLLLEINELKCYLKWYTYGG